MPTLQWKKFVSKNAYVPKLQLNAEAELVSLEELKIIEEEEEFPIPGR